MKIVASISKLIVGIIAIVNGLYSLFSNSNSVFVNFPNWVNICYLIIFVILGVFLVIGSILDFYLKIKKNPRKHSFIYQSDKFFTFFSNWYKQPGTLSIISGDLDWIKTENNVDIYKALIKKSEDKQLNLLLDEESPKDVILNLKNKGANVSSAPNNITTNYTFSCISIMDDTAGKIIVRDKHKNRIESNTKVIFEEISNTYVTDLLNALLDKRKEKKSYVEK